MVHTQFVHTAEYNRRIIQKLPAVFQREAESGIICGNNGINMQALVFELDHSIQLLETLLGGITFPVHIFRINRRSIRRTFQAFFNAGALFIRPGKTLLVGMQHQHILLRRSPGPGS
ncbi:hypothetical protein D3C75_678400 [compost metagenome]